MTYNLDETGLRCVRVLTCRCTELSFASMPSAKKTVMPSSATTSSMCGSRAARSSAATTFGPKGSTSAASTSRESPSNIRFRDLHLRDLSSNGIGVFGNSKQHVRDVWVTDVVIENCCNRYGDYLSEQVGPEKGSVREDQGLIAFYHVQDFVVRGCRLEKSRSDGTHFYRCRQGQFVSQQGLCRHDGRLLSGDVRGRPRLGQHLSATTARAA